MNGLDRRGHSRLGSRTAAVLGWMASPVGGLLPPAAMSELLFELRALRARASSVMGRPRLGPPPYRVELGAAGRSIAGWIGVDVAPGSDVMADVRWRIPLPNGSCEAIYSEHLVEHLRFRDEVPQLFAECRRLLRPGSPIRISVPDAALYVRGYVEGDLSRLAKLHPWGSTPMTTLNWAFHGYGHRFGWDAETLVAVMNEAGFDSLEVREHGDSRYPGLALDRPERAVESTYVEGRAPDRVMTGWGGKAN
ncbi:MAG: class I SAM-dependent methyltransferase [Acidimicrobiales bacterium]